MLVPKGAASMPLKVAPPLRETTEGGVLNRNIEDKISVLTRDKVKIIIIISQS